MSDIQLVKPSELNHVAELYLSDLFSYLPRNSRICTKPSQTTILKRRYVYTKDRIVKDNDILLAQDY
jgi:hypothetical protein